MRTVLVALGLMAVSFLAGHAYSEQRITGVIAESQRSCNLSVAETALRTLDLVKNKGLVAAEDGVVLVAKSSADDLSHKLITGHFSLPSIGADEAVLTLRERNDARYVLLQERLGKPR
jgi:hypothetical protein